MSDKKPYIGGQAVLEGVMMRAPGCMSVAVRRPDGQIVISEGPMTSRIATSKVWKWPGLRGVATLVESLSIGYRALNFSAEQQLTDEEREESKGSGRVAMVISTLIALGLFIALPQGAAAFTGHALGIELPEESVAFHAVTGGFKLLIFTGYLLAISRLPDIQRVFQYHGAEHKTIFAYEEGLELTVENVQKQSTLHPRCGTTFLIVVIVVSVIAGFVVTPLVLPLILPEDAPKIAKQVATLGIRIGLLPFIAAISYELQRFSARYCTTGPLRVLLLPGFLFQKITTREPTDDQVEIAITAMRTAMWREQVGTEAQIASDPVLFEDFASFLDGVDELRPVASAA